MFKNERPGVAHLKVSGKGGKTQYVPLHPAASGLGLDYLEAAPVTGEPFSRPDRRGRLRSGTRVLPAKSGAS